GAIKLSDLRLLRIELLLRDHAFFEEQLEALEVDFCVFARSLILGKLSFCLFELDLKRTRIDFGEQFALLDELAFLESDIHELALNAIANRDSVQRSDCSEAIKEDGKVA